MPCEGAGLLGEPPEGDDGCVGPVAGSDDFGRSESARTPVTKWLAALSVVPQATT